MLIIIAILALSIAQANHNIFDVNNKCTRLGHSNIYKCNELKSGTYYFVSEDVGRITFKRFQSDLIIRIDQDQNQNLQRIDAQYGVCPTVITNVKDLVVKVNTQDCGKEIIFTTTTITVKKKTTDGTVYTTNAHQKQESISGTTDACTNCPNQEEIIWGQLSTNIQIIIYAAIVCAPLSIIILIISCCLKSTKGRRYLLNCPRAMCREEHEVTPLETPMQGFGLFTKTRHWTRSSTYSTTIYSPVSSPTTTTHSTTTTNPTGSTTTHSTTATNPTGSTTTHSTTTTKETSSNKDTKPKTSLQP